MYRFAALMVLLFLFSGTKAQENQNAYLEKMALSIPASQTNSTTDISQYIVKHFETDNEKVRAIFIWVTNNISYSTDSMHRVILNEDRDQKIIVALRRKKGVCENFAAIFNDICIKSGIPSYIIEGNTLQNGIADKAPHVWCSAQVNESWYLYDPTWGASQHNGTGFNNDIQYYQQSPSTFIQTHLPYDPMLQFLDQPISYSEFISGRKDLSSNKSYFNYKDSLAAFEKMDSLSQYITSLSRIKRNGFPNPKKDSKIKQLLMEIELIHQDNDMSNYHNAISDYNNAIEIMNEWIRFRNQMFKGSFKETDANNLFNKIATLITSAKQKLEKIKSSTATLQLNTQDLAQKLDNLSQSSKVQKSYFKNYLLTSKNP